MNRPSVEQIFCRLMVFSSCLMTLACSLLTPARHAGQSQIILQGQGVSQQEYDSLFKKHQKLQGEIRVLKAKQNIKLQEIAGDREVATVKKSNPTQLMQTVELFPPQKTQDPIPTESSRTPEEVIVQQEDNPLRQATLAMEMAEGNIKAQETDIFELNKARLALQQGDHSKGMEILQRLQKSPYRQIQVRVQFFIGESLSQQGEFDLALQAYQNIIQQHAFSGLVIKALERIVVCTEKLKINDQREYYLSILGKFQET